MAKSKQESEHDVTFAEGGDTPMFKQQAAGPKVAGITGKVQSPAPGAKYAEGGSSKMFGFSPSQAATAGKTSAR